MAKKLRDILEVAKAVSPADKAFVAKHTIKTTPDANKNGDDVFKGKTKAHKRSPNHGYDVGADEKVYEETMTAADKAKEKAIKAKTDKSGMKSSMQKEYGSEKGKQVYFATIRKKAMEAVEIDEAAKASTLSALTGKPAKIDDYADMVAKFKAKGGAVTKVAAEVPDEKKAASLSATWTRGGGGKGGSSLATGEYASMNKKDAAYNAKQVDARKKAMGIKEDVALEDIPEEALHLDEGVSKDHYELHHKRAMSALNDIGKHLLKQKSMCDKSDNKWAHADQAWSMKDMARQLEDMAHGAAQRTENMTPVKPEVAVRGYY